MFNKKILIIFLGLLGLSIFFILLSALKSNKNISTPININSSPLNSNGAKLVASENKVDGNININNSTSTDNQENTNIINNEINSELDKVDQAKFLVELKNSHPEYTEAQLEFYSTTAKAKTMLPCRNRDDENKCIAAVAFITRINSFCGEIGDKNSRLECSDLILDEKANGEIGKCETQSVDIFKAQCLINFFNTYKQPGDCASLKSLEVKKVCESAASYQTALQEQDRKICDSILNESIKNYCLENIADNSPLIVDNLKDTDGDGLSDNDELNKYHTNILVADTDGDSYLDGAEVSGGYNPCGEGKLPDTKILTELCLKFQK